NRILLLDLPRERLVLGGATGDADVDEGIVPARLGGLVEQRDAAAVGERLDGQLAQRTDRRVDVERFGEPGAGVREEMLTVGGEGVGVGGREGAGGRVRLARHADGWACAAPDRRASVRE